ncbi:MAG: PQQ-like beta-propeller repeat protein [Opitutales bacterium]|jgi:outer membrane protein assembly factor BamB|nr:PQQ-like beta-propeller repeat protein [Opitutales bacterium]MBT5166983.1 PQQ-like beta-propeller repeat protein [Opitutales bacterium]MBT5813910.1 PQQ-like beta-propeller repeat protein [Opitutales bacterium]MBT6380538.1 PQQ-like beta-propeller repeat protein [Opitutales bacterium]MBT7865521.1 PQQ-like beta-propeller repeat protein [Opitutales bacterium]
MSKTNNSPTRWWPLQAIALLTIGFLLFVTLSESESRQAIVMKSIGIASFASILSLIWLLALSRLPWRIRIGVAAGLIIIGAGVGSAFKYEGVSGDLIPIFRWRWHQTEMQIALSESTQGDLSLPSNFISYSQFLGPNRNTTVSDISLNPDWESSPPQLLWKQPIGEAWSGFVTSGNRAFTQEQDGPLEKVVCYDLLSGKRLWENELTARYDNPLGGIGPRATPTIDENRLYTMGATGELQCLELTTGNPIWSSNVLQTHNAPLPDWGMSSSPLIHENLVIVNVGGSDGKSLVAYDKQSGDFIWGGGNDQAHWSSPIFHEIAGSKQILIFNRDGLYAHNVNTGAILWEHPWTKSTSYPRVAIPVLIPGDRIIMSSGYGAGAAMLKISPSNGGKQSVEEIWTSLHLKSKFNNFVFKDGYIYGLDDGMFTCIDIETGRRAWKKGRYGHGQLILVNDLLLLTAENGDIMLFDPTPEEPRVLGTFKALEGKSWNPPALVGPYLLVRNHLEAACYRIPLLDKVN